MGHVSARQQMVLQLIVMELRKSLPESGPTLCWNYQGQIGLYYYHSNPTKPRRWHINEREAVKLHKHETEIAILKMKGE